VTQRWLAVACAGVLSCTSGKFTGTIGSSPPGAAGSQGSGSSSGGGGTGGGGPINTMVPPAPIPEVKGDDNLSFASAVRRLTRSELRQTILDLVGVDAAAEVAKFPEDYAEANDVFAFDNKYSLQQPSASLIQSAKNLADTVGAAVLADGALAGRLLSCVPKGAGDDACLRTFVTGFGRRALRRPLTTAEVDGYVAKFKPFAVEANSFNNAVSLVVRAFLQDMEFLYRVEVGQPVAGTTVLSKLTGYEMASRLSYFLWGTTPDDALLDAAGAGEKLQTQAAVKAAATRMLADPRARRGVNRFHAMWMGYERQPPSPPLQEAMLAESRALIDKVVFEDRRPWLDLFRSKESFVDGALAAHYGMPRPAAAGWTSYGNTGRQGILSHGVFLGVERKHGDTSPTMRGQLIRTRLMCQNIPPPPANLGVDIDAVPSEGNCKVDRYSMWKKEGCKSCHTLMDPLGHGLEQYDRTGAQRGIAPDDAGKAGCELTGQGEVVGLGTFSGVAGLSERLIEAKVLETCVSSQLASFFLGREVRDGEKALFERVGTRFAAGGHRFDQMLMDFISLPGFGYRLAE
jgi:hypothetical protein